MKHTLMTLCVILSGIACAEEVVRSPMQHYLYDRELRLGETSEGADLLRMDLSFDQTTPTVFLAYTTLQYGVYGHSFTAYVPVRTGYKVQDSVQPNNKAIFIRPDYFYYGSWPELDGLSLVVGWLSGGHGIIFSYQLVNGELRGREIESVTIEPIDVSEPLVTETASSDSDTTGLVALYQYPKEAPLYIYKNADLLSNGVNATSSPLTAAVPGD